MRSEQKDALWFILQIIMIALIFFFIGMGVAESQVEPESSLESLSEPHRGILVQENSLVGIVSPYYTKPIVCGALIERVIRCESSGNHLDKNGNILRGKAGEYGICQFMPSTWKMFNLIRETNLDIMIEDDQLDMMVWAFKNGYANHWTCYRQLK
ncbi:MAG: hypothetical protein ACTSQE_06915 [Candidatus Heimdallarchaeaceae archaeon]